MFGADWRAEVLLRTSLNSSEVGYEKQFRYPSLIDALVGSEMNSDRMRSNIMSKKNVPQLAFDVVCKSHR